MTRLGVIFGGESEEHAISLKSAKSVMEHLDLDNYELVPIGIDRKGGWHFFESAPFIASLKRGLFPALEEGEEPLFPLCMEWKEGCLFSPRALERYINLAFPLVHGPYGEDGTLQGLLELAHIPYVGCGVLSSALCMDKEMMKRVLKGVGVPTPDSRTCCRGDFIDCDAIIEALSFPLFVKPARYGSSVGISKVRSKAELQEGLVRAFRYGDRAIVEKAISGREISCSLLSSGSDKPEVSLPGEAVVQGEFYSYEIKFSSKSVVDLILPAPMPDSSLREMERLASLAFQALGCYGMARADFFLQEDGSLLFNEMNTVPGFTSTSLYPKLWEISGRPYAKLLNHLLLSPVSRCI